MNGWQVDLMIENERNRAWEKLNAPDPYEKVLQEAAKELEKAIERLDKSTDSLADASAELSETPMQAKIDMFIETLEDIRCDLKDIREHWERGERE